jgi:hypothetical protein
MYKANLFYNIGCHTSSPIWKDWGEKTGTNKKLAIVYFLLTYISCRLIYGIITLAEWRCSNLTRITGLQLSKAMVVLLVTFLTKTYIKSQNVDIGWMWMPHGIPSFGDRTFGNRVLEEFPKRIQFTPAELLIWRAELIIINLNFQNHLHWINIKFPFPYVVSNA